MTGPQVTGFHSPQEAHPQGEGEGLGSSLRDTHRVAETAVVSGHTPGPWVLDSVPSSAAFRVAAGRAYGVSAKNAGGYRIPVVVWRGIAKSASAEGQANARLIAAAPDLLEAAIRAEAQFADLAAITINGEHDARDLEAIEALRAAIAKATTASSVEVGS